MTIDNIITIITSGASLISIIFYFYMFSKLNKKNAKETFDTIINKIPEYIQMTNSIMPGGNTLQKTNYILAMIKSECEEAHIKYKEKQAKKAVEEKM